MYSRTLAIYRQHEEQYKIKIWKASWTNVELVWRNKGIKGVCDEGNLKMLKEKCKFFEILKYINKKFYKKSLKEIILYPNNLQKLNYF